MKKILVSAVTALFISGCATEPVKYENAKQSTRVYAFQDKTLPSKILVTRDSGFAGSFCAISIYIDGTLAAELDTSEKVDFYVSESDHIVEAKHNCSSSPRGIEVTTKKEKPTKLRASVGYDGISISKTVY